MHCTDLCYVENEAEFEFHWVVARGCCHKRGSEILTAKWQVEIIKNPWFCSFFTAKQPIILFFLLVLHYGWSLNDNVVMKSSFWEHFCLILCCSFFFYLVFWLLLFISFLLFSSTNHRYDCLVSCSIYFVCCLKSRKNCSVTFWCDISKRNFNQCTNWTLSCIH